MRAIVPISFAAVVVPLCVGCGGTSTVEVEPQTPDTKTVEVVEPASTTPTNDVTIKKSGDSDSAEVEVESD